MLNDIVIDTNIFLHAENRSSQRSKPCNQLVENLLESKTHVCVDEGFDLTEARNRSFIGSEYLKHLRFGMIGFEAIRYLAQSGRIDILTKKVPSSVAKKINVGVTKGPDRIFVRVSFNSRSRTFASHDFGDIPAKVRSALLDSIEVDIVSADIAAPRLA